jgi:multicomponent Na+:H+ antiporter subunit A
LAAPWGAVVLAGLVAGSVLTFAYSHRFAWGAFATKDRARQRALVGWRSPLPSRAFVAGPALLVALTIATGILPASLDHLVNAAANALIDGEEVHLALWHGFTLALLLSVVTIALGVAVVWVREPLAELQERYGGWRGTQAAYEWSIKALNVVSDRITGVVQNGSLPIYLAVILLVAVALPTSALLTLPEVPAPSALAEDPGQLLVAIGIVVAAVAMIFNQRRFIAVLLVGAVGYGVALLFVLQGAPDLALTQFLIETLSVVVFMLVLRFLPPRFDRHRWRMGQAARMLTAAAVGVFVFFMSLIAGGSRPPSLTPISTEFLARSIEEAGGQNIVNVILVDFRGYDTLGEITVLLVAALGVAALVTATARDQGVGTPVEGSGGDGQDDGPPSSDGQPAAEDGRRTSAGAGSHDHDRDAQVSAEVEL